MRSLDKRGARGPTGVGPSAPARLIINDRPIPVRIGSRPCSGRGYSGNNLHLDSYTGVRAGGSGAGGLPRTVIVPGNAGGSYLWQAVEWTQKVGAPMPLGGQKIAQVDRTNIARWIDDGAKGP